MFQTGLYTAIGLSITGLLYQVFSFVRKNNAFEGGKKSSHGLNIMDFFLNTLFQIKLFNAGKARWLIHFLVVSGFLYLLIIHALDDVISFHWFEYYQPTLDPFQFLRNLAGFFVLAGGFGFLFRRVVFFKTLQERKILLKGLFSILLILMVVLSGFLLESVKILSEPVFTQMVEDYSDIDVDEDLEDLKVYWEMQYHTVFNETLVVSPEKFENGKILSESFCIDCHSPIKSAFISTAMAKGFKKTGVWLNQHRADNVLYYIHYFLALLILVSLPFSRLFHMFLIPVASLGKNLEKEHLDSSQGFVNTATLYACTNCGFCSDVCSVYPNFLVTEKIDILPHSKIESFKRLLNHTPVEPEALFRLKSGNDDCTYCHKCTDICPSGIDLQTVWSTLNQQLILKGYSDNYTFIHSKSLKEWAGLAPEDEKVLSTKVLSTKDVTTQLADDVRSFENCVQCTICTNVCPVVEHDVVDNDMTPQQIMNLLRLGKKHLATGTRMVGNCLTCFSCQEYCPQGIKVADIMLELRNNAHMRAETMKLENITKKRER